jgi:hypothetical protein
VHSRNDALIQFLYRQLRDFTAAGIADLPERERLVKILYDYEEFGLAQIGIAVGESYTRASQIYCSGLLNLCSRLGNPVGKWQPTIHTSARPPTNGSTASKKTVRPGTRVEIKHGRIEIEHISDEQAQIASSSL